MIRQTVFAASAVALLAACTEDGRIGERTGAGAIIGGVAGAVTGALIGDRTGAAIGAGIGAVAGAGIGAYLDQQQRELERNLEGTGATVTNTGEELLVNLPSEVTFAFDSAEIQPRFFDPLAQVADTLTRYESSLVDVVGHTDSIGSDRYNEDLSQRRANSVAGFLTSRGVIRERVLAVGRGETQPVDTNDTEAGRARNRRVELVITPITEGS
ncbi:MAG: OmpA family protein [Pseudomonadota bacterium]